MDDKGLRRDVADYIEGHYRDRAEALQVADHILAIPVIAEALKLRFLIKAGALVDADTKV